MKKLIKWLFGDTAARKSARNNKRYLNWLTTHAPSYSTGTIELRLVYTCRNGENIYLPKDLLSITMERKAKIEETQSAFDYGMTRGEILERLKEMLDGVKSLPFQKEKNALEKFCNKSMADLSDLIFRAENIKTESVILDISLLLFFIDGEDPYRINELTQKKKRDLAMRDDDLRAFFLQTTIALLKQSTSTESEDLQKH